MITARTALVKPPTTHDTRNTLHTGKKGERVGESGGERERVGESGEERERVGESGEEREKAGNSGEEREREWGIVGKKGRDIINKYIL